MPELEVQGRDIVCIGDKKSHIDGYLRKNLADIYKEVRQDSDALIIVDGRERIGKSVMAMTIAWLLSEGKLNLNDICLTSEEFKNRVYNSKKYDVIIFDEAYLGLASADHMKIFNRLLKKMLVTCGQKNLILILVLPSIFDLDKYVALHRSDVLIHCFKHQGKRGHFSFYSKRKVQQLYIYGKKTYSYWIPKSNFYGNYTNFYPVNEEEYRKKKLDSLNSMLDSPDEEETGIRMQQYYRSIAILKEKVPTLRQKDISDLIGCSQKTVSTACIWCKQNPLGKIK